MKRILFWNVDTQVDFMNPDGKLYVKGAEAIKPYLKVLTDLARQYELKVVNTADYHDENTQEISASPDFITKFPEHCMVDSYGATFIEETQPLECIAFPHSLYSVDWTDEVLFVDRLRGSRNIVILKDKFDVFEGNLHTEEILSVLKPDLVVVYGVAGDYCVNYAVKGLVERKYNVAVVVDAIKSLNEAPLKEWDNLGVTLINTTGIINLISKLGL
jgi:nicotinamidase/pyrazinamidase